MNLENYARDYEDVVAEMDRFQSVGVHDLIANIMLPLLDYRLYYFYLDVPIDTKYDPLDVIYQLIDTDYFMYSLSNKTMLPILMNDPIINKISSFLSRREKVPQLLATSIILGLVEIIDRYTLCITRDGDISTVPYDFWMKLLTNAIAYKNERLATLLITNGKSIIEGKD